MATSLRRSEHLLLIAVLIAAAFLRVEYLLQIEHNIDHAYPVWQALNTLEHGTLPLTGQSTSVLFANPALTGYLYLPLVALARSPVTPYILVIALNTLAVLLVFRAVRGLLGVPAALTAAALMAVNPWVIEYSRTSWVQSLLPFFACALAWLLWPVLTGRSRSPARRLLLALLMLTLMTQTYLLAYLMVVPVAALIVIFWRWVPKQALLIGGAVFTAASVLYGAALLADSNALQRRLDEFGTRPARLSTEALNHALRLVTGKDYAAARGVNAPAGDSALRQNLSEIAHVALLAAFAVGIGAAFTRRKGLESAPAVILLIWFGLPVLLMSYVGQPVHPFYQLLGLPAGYALAGWGLTTIFRPPLRPALVIPFAVLMGINSARYYQETAVLPGAHGTTALSLEYGLKLGQLIRENLPENGIVYADESPWILNSFSGQIFSVERLPQAVIIPQNGGLYLNAAVPLPGAAPTVMLTLRDGYTLTLDAYAPGAADSIQPPHPLDYASEQGLRLIGYDFSADALTTYWRAEANGGDPAALFAPFVHVFDEAGARVQIIDGAIVPGTAWHPGDVHIHVMPVTLPEGDFQLQVGQYDSTREQNVIFLPDYAAAITLPGWF